MKTKREIHDVRELRNITRDFEWDILDFGERKELVTNVRGNSITTLHRTQGDKIRQTQRWCSYRGINLMTENSEDYDPGYQHYETWNKWLKEAGL